MQDATYIRQISSISIGIAKYFFTILLKEYAKGQNTGPKLVKKTKGNERTKRKATDPSFSRKKKS